MSKPRPFREDEVAYLEANRHNTTAADMAEHLNRGTQRVLDWLKEKGYRPYRKPKVPADDHPLRRHNRQLEQRLKHWDIINGKNGPI